MRVSAETKAATRNRILDAARRLFAERGPAAVSMEDVARAAGVGKGTLYRRYRDKAALAVALLDEQERALQEELLRGSPPLGPGAPPAERLAAFYAAIVELTEANAELALAAEHGGARYRTGGYAFWRAHVRSLLSAGGRPDPPGALAEVLLAPLAVELYQHLRRQGVTRDQVVATLATLAESVLAPAD